jgi:hypothetical protein
MPAKAGIHYEVTLEVIVASIVMDPGSEAGMTKWMAEI